MGISIGGKNVSISFDCGYMTFGNFRKNIAIAFDEEFGNHYASLFEPKNIFKGNDDEFYKEFDKKANEIVSRKKLDSFVVRFLFQSDCDGSASPTACKKLAELIKKSGKQFSLSYAAHVGPNETENIIKFLEECHTKKSRMEWS